MLQLLGDTDRIPFGLGTTKAGSLIGTLMTKMPDLVDTGKELIKALRAPNAAEAIQHATNFYKDILKMAELAPLRANLATALDQFLSDKLDMTLAQSLKSLQQWKERHVSIRSVRRGCSSPCIVPAPFHSVIDTRVTESRPSPTTTPLLVSA